jgi:hypothetical protein
MKETRSLLNSLIVCGVALAMVSTLAAQTANQGCAKVIRLKGGARYKVGNNDWQQLSAGDILKPGTLIQTAGKSRVDLILGDASAPVARPSPSDVISYAPTTEQNVVRISENTLLGIDKLTETQTGADVVTETQLDLKAGHIFGTVKKMSAASKYEVKLPSGVAGIRGTVYDITAEGVVKVLYGSVVLAYVGPDGTVVTQVVMAGQQFDARTGVLSQLSEVEMGVMKQEITQLRVGVSTVPIRVSANNTLLYVSPH